MGVGLMARKSGEQEAEHGNMRVVRIRYGVPNDREALEAIQHRASTALPEYRDAILRHPDAIEVPLLLLGGNRVKVAETRSIPVGFSVLLAPAEGIAELDGLFVDPAYWGQGIGWALMLDAVSLAAAENADAIEVTANPRAEGFYAKFGFTRLGQTTTRFGPAMRMTYSLQDEMADRRPRKSRTGVS